MANSFSKFTKGVLTSVLALSGVLSTYQIPVVNAAEFSVLSSVTDVKQDGNVVYLTYANGEKTKITFLEDDIFRFNMDPDGEFEEYPVPNSEDHVATIVQQSDSSKEYTKPTPTVADENGVVSVSTGTVKLEINKETALMKLHNKKTGKVLWEETKPLSYAKGETIQTLKQTASENYYGGGTQNGRFLHTGENIQIVNTNNWIDGGVASPNPFYWSTAGYGVLRDTWEPGSYDFGHEENGVVTTKHSEERFDAYYFVDPTPEGILQNYYKVTGKPVLLPENSFYLGHLNCYNRDVWKPVEQGGNLLEDGKRYKETNNNGAVKEGETIETLNGGRAEGDYKFSARAVIDGHIDNDMPLGWFLPNDGYGCGYGQSDTDLDANVDNLKQFTEYANARGVGTGLWTQSNLTPNPKEPIHLQRDFNKEVNVGGIRTLKTDVAWVGAGYSFGLNGIKTAYDIITETGDRPNIITLDGWAGTQRYGGIWTGDQTGGQWEYIRFHIPTYVGQALSGNPNIGSDMDGIFGGGSIVATRDYQWKIFTQYMLDMDGWGSNPKKPYIFGEDFTSINRMYLKLKAQLMPYIYTESYKATNGLPSIRAMFLNYPEEAYAYSKNTQYQFMFGDDFLVAPIYQNTKADEKGNDVRNDIYLPDANQIWIDYFSGKQYRGGQILDEFEAPIWKLPLFVKNGAIIPMYAENNNAMPKSETNTKGLDKTQRIVEFYPEGTTSYELYEDDGVSVDASNVEEPVYGDSVSTTFTSVVKDGKATLTAQASKGSYAGYDSKRDTTFVVNVSKEPTKLEGKVGSKAVTFKKVNSEKEFNEAKGNVYFYNEKPNLNKYATKGSEFEKQAITTTPKVFVKFEKTDVNANAVSVVVSGFENKQVLAKNQLNENLAAPTNVRTVEDEIEPTSIPVYWDKVEGATGYDVEVDGAIHTGIVAEKYVDTELDYNSTHSYRVRATNMDGYSQWSEAKEFTSALDPYRNCIPNLELTCDNTMGGYPEVRLIDLNTIDYWFSNFSDPEMMAKDKTFDFNFTNVYKMDKVVLYPHKDFLGGKPTEVSVYASMDGVKYEPISEHETIQGIDPSDKVSPMEVSLKNTKMRYLRLVVHKPQNFYVCLTEIMPMKVDGTSAYIYGDVTSDGKVDANDLTMMQNYVGLTPVDADWEYVADKGCDFNGDKVIDAVDVSVIANIVNKPNKPADVAGQMSVLPSKTNLKAGEEFYLDVFGLGMENVNAFSVQIPYDASKFEYVNIVNAEASMDMTTFSKPRAHTNGLNELFVVFANTNSKTTIKGTKPISRIILRAKEDVAWNEKVVAAKLVGNNNSVVADALIKPSDEEPVVSDGTKQIVIPGENVVSQKDNPLQEGMGPDKLVDGNVGSDAGRFEFKWGNDAETVGAKLPHELTYTFEKPAPASKLRVQVRHEGNTLNSGALKDFELYGIKDDDSRVKLGTFTVTKFDQTFTFNADQVAYKGIVLKALTSQGGQEFKLNIDETTFYTTNVVAPKSISFADNTPNELFVGSLTEIKAVVAPENVTDSFYTITSSNEKVAKVTRIKTAKNKFAYILQTFKPGSVEVTATAHGNAEITKTMTIDVVPFNTDKAALKAALDDVKALDETAYTTASWAELELVVNNANAVLKDKYAEQAMIDEAVSALETAKANLVKRGDVNKLNEIKAEANKLNKLDYTEESWAALQEALRAADEVIAKADNASEKDVADAQQAVKDAMDALVKAEKPNPDKPDPETPDPDKPNPENPDPEVKPDPDKPNPEVKPNPQKPEVKPEESKPVPPTGDTSNQMAWMITLVGAAIVALEAKKRKAIK